MSIQGSMYNGVAGLNSHSQALAVVSDNIANVNTVGYKASRANFADILGGTIAGDRVGGGSMISSVQTLFGQGALLGTGVVTDVALQGDGFFMVSPPTSDSAPLYTRAGQFELDQDGFLVNQQGYRVQGFQVDGNGQLGSALADLQFPSDGLAATPSTNVALQANLDASTAVATAAFDVDNPDSTSQYQTGVTVYDSLGRPHPLELYFTKLSDSPQQWQVNVTAPGGDVVPAGAGSRALLGTGTLDFNNDGSLATNSLGSVGVSWAGADAETITLDLGPGTAAGGTGFEGLTTSAGASAAAAISQNGNSRGDLGGIDIGDDGIVTGLYTNGETRSLGQIATARFMAADELAAQGAGMFAATSAAGDPTIGAPGSGGHGTVVSGSLEASNVDLAHEFVTMIAVQRGFQGNSRSITTADDMLSEVVNLKR